MSRALRSPRIHKFGGASLADAPAIAHAVSIVRAQGRVPIVVVVSALAGVTDALLKMTRRGAANALRRRHAHVARALFAPGARRTEMLGLIEDSFAELDQLVRATGILREITPRTQDYVVARGERLSAHLFAAALEEAGCRAAYVDARVVVKTDGTFGGAAPDLARTERAARKALRPLLARAIVPVVPGFLGAAPNGAVATLGRGGSDLTATLLARALGSREVSLWKDVPGVLSADPKVVPDARVVPQLHVREAAELAYYGAKVLHPRALIPLANRALAVRIRPFASPASPGSEISRRHTLTDHPVKALSAVPGQALITVTGNGMLGVPGIAARTFAAVQQEGISVSLISQASSEHSICFSVPDASAQRARASLRATFHNEIARREIDGVEMRRGAATLDVVGLGMAGAAGGSVAARTFSALSEAGIEVIAIAQGSSELNLSLVVDGRSAAAAQRAIHAALRLTST